MHTPGLWHLSESAKQPTRAGICTEYGLHVTDVYGYGMTDAQNEDNARLIAAVPELLEALKGVVQIVINYGGSPCEWAFDSGPNAPLKLIAALIAKAEGR